MKKFNATATRTQNTFLSIVMVDESFAPGDDDGYAQTIGSTRTIEIEIHGYNSYNRARALADCINVYAIRTHMTRNTSKSG